MKNTSNNKNIIWLSSITVCLLLYVVFAFQIRNLIRPTWHVLADLFFLFMLILFVRYTRKCARIFIVSSEIRAITILLFVGVSFYLLAQVSSFNRQSAASHFVENNEEDLLRLVREFSTKDQNPQYIRNCLDEHMLRVTCKDDRYELLMYRFLGYGYGIIYSDSVKIEKPWENIGGRPIVKWFPLKDHWYYYSFLD